MQAAPGSGRAHQASSARAKRPVGFCASRTARATGHGPIPGADNARMRYTNPPETSKPTEEAHAEEDRRHRRQLAHAPRLPCRAADDERPRRHAHERRVRLSCHAAQVHRHGQPRRHHLRVRRGPPRLPHESARAVQGAAPAHGRRPEGAVPHHRGAARGHGRARRAHQGLGGRRHLGHGGRARRGAGLRDAARDGRQGRLPAGQRQDAHRHHEEGHHRRGYLRARPRWRSATACAPTSSSTSWASRATRPTTSPACPASATRRQRSSCRPTGTWRASTSTWTTSRASRRRGWSTTRTWRSSPARWPPSCATWTSRSISRSAASRRSTRSA